MERPQGCELFKSHINAAGVEVTVEHPVDLVFGQAVLGGFGGFANAVGDRISRGEAKELGGALL